MKEARINYTREWDGGVMLAIDGWLEGKAKPRRVSIDGKEYRVRSSRRTNSLTDMKGTVMLLDTTDEIRSGAMLEFLEIEDDETTD